MFSKSPGWGREPTLQNPWRGREAKTKRAQNDSAMEGDGGETGAIISPRDSPIPWAAAAATQLSTLMASGYGSRVWLVFIK